MIADILLAPNFGLRELARTTHRSLQEQNLREAYANLDALRQTAALLQAVRDHYISPVIVHSGYRCRALNEAIGGATRSQHLAGEAADFHVVGRDLETVWRWIWRESRLRFSQCILEGWAAGAPTWIHLGIPGGRAPDRCGEVLTWNRDQGYHLVARV